VGVRWIAEAGCLCVASPDHVHRFNTTSQARYCARLPCFCFARSLAARSPRDVTGPARALVLGGLRRLGVKAPGC